MLEKGVSDHRHERVTVKALPGSSLEMIKTEFFFHLLVSLPGESYPSSALVDACYTLLLAPKSAALK